MYNAALNENSKKKIFVLLEKEKLFITNNR